MTFNLTFAVQIVHFLIAYYVLERIFFRPAVRTLEKRDMDLHNKEHLLEEQRRIVETLQLHVKEQGQQRQQALLGKAPSLDVQIPEEHLESFYKEKQQQLTVPPKDSRAEAALIKNLEQSLVGKILS